ncbi:BTB/POZ domain-containing protein At4g08455 [Linum grandiflorum]
MICVFQATRSPVFRAMLANEMEESISGTIKISDVSYDALRTFVSYMYTAEARLDEQMACDLLVLAEKYQIKHLKGYCEKFLVSKLNWDSSLMSYAFAHQHNATHMLEASLSLITENMDKLAKREEYLELVEKDPRLVVEIYEAYLSKQVNTAAHRECSKSKKL